ncbi:Dyp-type peroxidase [Rheinheimera sp. WS51]|uniref:Dyp-type peroxidase n=1 Tax=Rheinheimera sp. WS51 TaxID=3425886 RepID=UPI003D90EA70
MAREQLGICTEANLHGSYLLLNALEGHERQIRHKLARVPALIERLSDHFSEAMLTSVIAIGSNFWDSLYPDSRPIGLAPFPSLQHTDIELAEAPIDLFIQVRSDRQDVNYIACQQLLQLLESHVEIQDTWQGFRYLDGRNLTGFVDVPNPPKGRLKRQVALVDQQQQPLFAAGSYVFVQQVIFDLKIWQHLTLAEQEQVMGIDKVTGKVLADERQIEVSHWALTEQTDTNSLVLRQNMPFAQLKQQGNIEVSYAACAEVLVNALTRRLGGNAAGASDQLLDYSQFACSAAFFAPSISFLELAINHQL